MVLFLLLGGSDRQLQAVSLLELNMRLRSSPLRRSFAPHRGATRKPGFLRFPVGKYLIVYEIWNDEVCLRPTRWATCKGMPQILRHTQAYRRWLLGAPLLTATTRPDQNL